MAAAAAVCAAAEAPKLVTGIVLIGPFVRVMGPKWRSWLMANVIAFPLWGVAVWGKYFTTLYPTARPADFGDYFNRLKVNLKEPGRMHALKAMLADTKAASDARLSQVKVPVHILMGTRDPDFKEPAQEVLTIVARLSATHVTTQMIEGAGHYPHAEMPEPALKSILAFFATFKERTSYAN
jgi:pimeloyl-ACP methyl ester carboxylesterase